MLLTFLYHRAIKGKYANPIQDLKENLLYLKERYPIVLPGDPIPFYKWHVCLTFDDAYFDFYHLIFPLLKELKIKALLAVPVKFLLPTTCLSPEKRLLVSYQEAMRDDIYEQKAPFCTWEELKEISASGLVQIASHSFSHADLSLPGIDLNLEIIFSKKLLQKNLRRPIQTFVYPLGKFNRRTHSFVKRHYPFIMRIGSACNISWNNCHQLIYRISSDNLISIDEKLKPLERLSQCSYFLLNSIRGR